jgi:hypothetical protein
LKTVAPRSARLNAEKPIAFLQAALSPGATRPFRPRIWQAVRLCRRKREAPPHPLRPSTVPVAGASCVHACRFRGGKKGPDWPGLQAMEENMQSTKPTFNHAARGFTGYSVFWLMVFAIAIIDDGESRTKKRKGKRDKAPKPPSGPRFF